jgi:hypothetical protein
MLDRMDLMRTHIIARLIAQSAVFGASSTDICNIDYEQLHCSTLGYSDCGTTAIRFVRVDARIYSS